MKTLYKSIFYFTGILGIFLFYNYFPLFFPESKIKFNISNQKAKDLAIQKIIDFGFDTTNYIYKVNPIINTKLCNFLIYKYGLIDGNNKLQKYEFCYYLVQASRIEDMKKVITIGDENQIIDKVKYPNYLLHFDSKGSLLYFKQIVPDTFFTSNVDSISAYTKSYSIVQELFQAYKISFLKSEKNYIYNRKEIIFHFSGSDSIGNNIFVDLLVQGNNIAQISFKYDFEKLEIFSQTHDEWKVLSFIPVIIIIILILIMIVNTFRRYKNDEVDFKITIIFGVLLSLIYSIYFFLMIYNMSNNYTNWYALLLPTVFVFIIFALISIVVLTGTESISRLSWSEKYFSIDALRNGLFYSKKVKESFLNGIFLSGNSLLITILFYILLNIFKKEGFFYYPSGNSAGQTLGFSLASVYSSISFIFLDLFSIILYSLGAIVFIPSLLKYKLNSKILVYSLGIFIISLVSIPSILKPESQPYTLIFNFVFSIYIFLIFLKFDLVTVIVAYFMGELFSETIIYSYLKIDYSNFNFIILVSIIALILLFTFIIMLRRKKNEIEYSELAPKYFKRITERERIGKEIEAARHIQKSFLPYATPNFRGLEIASNCIPAYEVGGDYYDYFVLDKNRLGIVIADVSGKGVKAAFYMTLIKGIIKAQTQFYITPKEVVSKLNKLLYEIVEKGNFVSLIYGVFDLENKCFIYCNAGHNPLIYKDITSGKISYEKNSGMALGLAEESIHDDNINEKILQFRPGDLFILYTDGYIEAMNKNKEEFGSDAFLDHVIQISNELPSEIIKQIELKIKNFIGRAEQHDDMTIVVVRIK